MTRKFFILLMLLFGLFLVPNETIACTMKVENVGCNKVSSSESKSCCKTHDNSSTKQNSGCTGKCNHSTTSSIFHFGVIQPIPMDIKVNLVWIEKQNFYYSKTTISSGYSSIWVIPKIA